MFRLVAASLCIVSLVYAASSAQDKKGDDPKKEVKKDTVQPRPKSPAETQVAGDCEIHFLNGSKVRMIVQSEKLEVATLYGKLSVPVKDVRGIEFGLHYPSGVEARIAQAVKDLGSGDYRDRGKADKALNDFGPLAYPAILEASRGKEPEVANRAKEIAKKLQAKYPKKELKTMVEDKIMTHTFTIVGRILTPTIKSTSEYFGDVELALAKMRSLRALGLVSQDADLAIDSSKYGNAGQWLDTGFYVDGRSGIVITAKGLIDVWPQRGGQYMSSPNGYQATANGGGPGGVGVNMGGRKVGNALNAQMHCGMLLGKIGEDGEMFTVGDRYHGIPDREGKLFLHIGPSQWNAQCAGSFDVRIALKND